MEQIRSFIAIELPDEVKRAIGRVQAQLREGSRAPAKWVDPGGLHLTLKFLGNVDANAVGRITAALQASIPEIEYIPTVKGPFIERMRRKLDDLARRRTNEIMPGSLDAMKTRWLNANTQDIDDGGELDEIPF